MLEKFVMCVFHAEKRFALFDRGNLEIARRLNIIDASEVAITIVTVEEQLRERFQVIRRAVPNDLVSA
ncbi:MULTISPECIES: hypothetical protein [unclassified Nostoc]|uniref:hypothetical protein n=1 Tax=unclassified Nostoc TaxID=2593658 RepID=UPI0025AABABD|nr:MULTISPECIES: hypothetical protein [unclassified Nostoc]MDM9581393.1 hypothetical protein [Nostoc sp. GT001]MDZ7949007.1 hypothetical protein [Nostoc sp. EfeVER01]MDZ7992518.1 hypothetical protein [Nostoc sp. EspVER01]